MIQSNLEYLWIATNVPPNLNNPTTISRANPPRLVAPLAKTAPIVGLLNYLAKLTLVLLNPPRTPLIKAQTDLRET